MRLFESTWLLTFHGENVPLAFIFCVVFRRKKP